MHFFVPLLVGGLSLAAVPKWTPTYDMKQSSFFMPCNYSGFLDPEIAIKWGVVDFDWSNAKGMWTRAKPMDCEERLVTQAEQVKSLNKDAKVWVYRNLVKALPWYSSVREKMTDPQYEGFFLKFKPGGTMPNNSYHVPKCSESLVGNAPKCSKFYHDQEQTPQNGANSSVIVSNGWDVYMDYNGVSGTHPCDIKNMSTSCQVWRTSAPGSDFPTWEACRDAADEAMKINTKIRLFTWWASTPTSGACWFHHEPVPDHNGHEKGHVMGYKGPKSDAPQVSSDYNTCDGDCDCGDELPCGEYLWDHRNGSMLRDFLINEFVLNNKTGLGNPNVNGFFFDDGWSDKPAKIPSWAKPSYKQCNMYKFGGATEEDYNCVNDTGLTQNDTTWMVAEHGKTMDMVYDAVIRNGGFVFQQLTERSASLDLADPRPAKKCNAFMRDHCQPGHENETLMYEFTRKVFHDAFPLPLVEQDLAQFLLIRQQYALIGHNWMGCIKPDGYVNGDQVKGYYRPPEMDQDFGVPVDKYCKETSTGSGIYTRKWTKADVSFDCNKYEGKIVKTSA